MIGMLLGRHFIVLLQKIVIRHMEVYMEGFS